LPWETVAKPLVAVFIKPFLLKIIGRIADDIDDRPYRKIYISALAGNKA
jgi:hypothetical protein